MTGCASEPRRLRVEARAVLLRVRALDRSAHDGGALTVEELGAVVAMTASFADRLDEALRRNDGARGRGHLEVARRDIAEAHRIVVALLGEAGGTA